MEQMSDEQLLAASCAGDRLALAQLVERYQATLTGYLDRPVGPDWALAQDLAQETFLRVLRQQVDRGAKPFAPWLFAIATNLARSYHASAAVRHRPMPIDAVFVDTIPAADPDPEAQALLGERRQEIITALNSLGMEYRSTLLLRFYAGLSLRETAAALDVPVGTVKSRLSVGLRRLRSALTPEQLYTER